ncbi:hypothetical protein [Streptomyces sp. NBC_00467]|uniref:hypothetical protein n=1 Tax=Streptomyces sp. NBC_00467 TaxID=2975752 RepID=UPI002E18E0DF
MEAEGQAGISCYTHHHRESLENVIAANAAGKQTPAVGERAREAVDLMAALNASVQAAKESRGEARRGRRR